MSSSNIHNMHIEKLKTNFDNIISLKTEIARTKLQVSEKLQHLKDIYGELLKSNSKKIFLFCLDSFYFQYKTFAIEMDNIDRFRVLMNNRMYCDYYKLYNIIINSIKENNEIAFAENEVKLFPPYKDLEPFQEYKIEDIKDIHENILALINKLHAFSSSKKYNIDHYNEKHRIGFSISNFINTLEYENRLTKEQISLYINYLSFFHISQKKQVQRLFSRINDFHKEINDNINVNKTFSIDDVQEEHKLNRFFVTTQDVAIENILEDSELLIQNSESVIGKIENIIMFKESQTVEEPEEIGDILSHDE
uniref:Uncharacterized protein n=1 Tax=viral metagenome TaxID=1070528 RepID=A0A6C0B6Y5_9ZZZZ